MVGARIPDVLKTLVVCGGGRCLWDDLQQIPKGTDLLAVNDSLMHIPWPVKYGFSNDAKRLCHWAYLRRRGYEGPEALFSIEDWREQGKSVIGLNLPTFGTSSLNAVRVGLILGYERIVLAGVPLDSTGHYFSPPCYSETDYNLEDDLNHWRKSAVEWQGKVKSLSGHTREILGDV